MENEQQCTRRVILVLTLDCEEGNKKAMQMIKEAVEDATIDTSCLLLLVLADSPHVGKSLKASFSNGICS